MAFLCTPSSPKPSNMTSFSSKTAKTQAKSAINKLLAVHLPGTSIDNSNGTLSRDSKASAAVVLKQLSRRVNSKEIKKVVKSQKEREKKKILKNLNESKRFNKIAKYNMIKQHKETENLTPEEAKYLKKLVKRNVASLNSLREIEDEGVKDDMRTTKRAILASLETLSKRDLKKSLKKRASSEFNTKIKKGYISYPGLTPGLAPVDYNESEEE